ncbi:MAG: DEAD/DEAH box helicase [Pseudomonadota bacterium]|nr:DEAD/DEAH box helicase [Pseudomonadota bacterium]
MSTENPAAFSDLALSPAVFQALEKTGYERPSPIQAKTIPLLLAGHDLIGQAQTGTGKTAAFALPVLSQLDMKQKSPQVLVLAPTRELAIQVAEAFQTYAAFIPGFNVLPIYGGADYRGQLQGLKRGAHVVVGTPGRVMDHMRRGSLDLTGLKTIVLDEADEMLRMGFIDDVEWVLEQAPAERQIVLFSATMPTEIRKIATRHLREPQHVTIEVKTVSADTIRQRYWTVRGVNKLDALTRILEAEAFSAMLIFVRTKTLTVELADKLSARGFAASAINGDMSQQLREATIDKLKAGKLDILVATDVAARGLDVDRITHVVNYDIPYDVETYIHRIGRTGRAGREGDAILFVAPREMRMLAAIERATRKKITLMELPSTDEINDKRVARFMQQITDTLAAGELAQFQDLVARYEQEHNVPAIEIAAALARLLQGNNPLFLESKPAAKDKKDAYRDRPEREVREPRDKPARAEREQRDRPEREQRDKPEREQRDRPERESRERPEKPARAERDAKRERRGDDELVRDEFAEKPARPRKTFTPDMLGRPEAGMERYRIEVGHEHAVRPSNIVGAIANEADIDSKFIGKIEIFDDFSLVELPEGMPPEVFEHLKKVWVANKQLDISRFEGDTGQGSRTYTKKPARKDFDRKPDFAKGERSERKFDRKPPGKSFGKPAAGSGQGKFNGATPGFKKKPKRKD